MCGSCCCQQVCCQSNVGNSLYDYRIVYIIPKDSVLAEEISKGFISCTCQQTSDAAPPLPAPVKVTEKQEVTEKHEATEKQETTETVTTTTIETTEISEKVTENQPKEEPVVQIQEPEIKRIEVKIKGKSEAVVVVFDSNVGSADSKNPEVYLFKEEPGPDRDLTQGKQLDVTRQEVKSVPPSVVQSPPRKDDTDRPVISRTVSDRTVGRTVSDRKVTDKPPSSTAIARLYVSSQQDLAAKQKVSGGCIHSKESCCSDCCPDNRIRYKKKKKKKDKEGGFFSQCCSCCRADKQKQKGRGKKHRDKRHHRLDQDRKNSNEGTKYDVYRSEGSSRERMKFESITKERSKTEAGKCACEYSRRNACRCTGCHKRYTETTSVYSSKTSSLPSSLSSNPYGSPPFPRDEYRGK